MTPLALLRSQLPDSAVVRLSQGLAELQLEVTPEQQERLLGLLALLHKWNRAYNLTAVRDVDTMVSRHLLDSAAVLPFVKGPRLLDVGAGPGFPGLVLAILAPSLEVTLLDSNGKKVRFQRQAVMELGLSNVSPVQARVESFAQGQFDQVISRAFASLADFIAMTRKLPVTDGQWLAMKGPGADEELRQFTDHHQMPEGIRLHSRHKLNVPFESAERQLLILTQQGVE
ncbi:16S rRNA (guanine(527)-N(7))-methyltransferase RsmG [Vreelandella rituensis]|uniref:Ribosomal RNA small subunit methyltransferase G n=1 Tax=Vreelandella rituensis TaxID=2282306 RepID=A0A368U7K8_9GAMM|nr:16S rRNA (guanine(527)-N(7))-methyltransferase RsmG [Halomonas rituensis]RCV92417.1 16S rRNA (guanine(527)-N(7))-methyltransferase RsmG [Halomonas rituensis]